MSRHNSSTFIPLNIAVLTISDTRNEDTDSSGALLVDNIMSAGHTLGAKAIVHDDIYQIRSVLSQWIADPAINAVVCTGGTGFTARDNTPEAVSVLFDKDIEGFGELFRQISYNEIGTSTIQSRSLAGMANQTVIFCLPGSTNACRTGWTQIISAQLDARQGPCNFITHLNVNAQPCSSRD